MTFMCRTLAHAPVKGLRAADVTHQRIDIEIEGLVALAASQSPADDGGNVAIPHIPAPGDATVVIQYLTETPIFPLQLLQPR
ncbi:hypothetical protein RRF57_011262 [Xylaria bambusicola]|uniref:Uncharacterized protein n=1 Tax=Xylaria bambusicola TaxID=326684 RepID=A0AAN7UMH8_9PEZI